jgi:hypothetical protein
MGPGRSPREETIDFAPDRTRVPFTIVRPLELTLVAKPRHAQTVSRVADVVELRLRNASGRALEVLPPSSGRLRFEVEGSEKSWPSGTWRAEDDAQPARSLAAGDELELLGEDSPNPALFYEWHHPVAEVVRIRAAYRPYDDRPGMELRSQWVEVDLR